jgi:RNA polymerase sigma factor (sigma-70 family)
MKPRTTNERSSLRALDLETRCCDHAFERQPSEEELLNEYTPELMHLARRFSYGDAQLSDDLFQEGAIGLINAARRFEPSRGVKFSTLARRHIKGRMLNYVRRESRQSQCLSLHEACYSAGETDEQNPPQEDCLPITACRAITEIGHFLFNVDLLMLQHPLRAMAEILTPRQYQIFSMRYSDGFTPSEVAHTLNISPARVTQALNEAVAKLRRVFLRA